MKSQWMIVLGIGLTMLAALIAVFNVEPVTLNYIFGEVAVSLILIVLASILLGGLLVAIFGFSKPYRLKKEKRAVEHEKLQLEKEVVKLNTRIHELEGKMRHDHSDRQLVNGGSFADMDKSDKALLENDK